VSGFTDPILDGTGNLTTRAQEQSPNFIHGTSGWRISQDGSAEFNNGTFRGTVTASTFTGTDFIINSDGAFFYAGAPAAGNLIVSIASLAGIDAFGNAYTQGLNIFTVNITSNATVQIYGGVLDWSNPQFVFTGQEACLPAGATNDTPALVLSSPTNTPVISGSAGTEILLQGGSADGSSAGWIQLTGINANTGVLQGTVIQAVGQLVATKPGVTPGTTPATSGIETWHAVPLTNSWTNSGNPPAAQYRKLASPPNSIEVVGRISHAAVSGTSQIATALPSGYIPTHAQDRVCAVFGNTAAPVASPVLSIDATGVLTLFDLPTGTTGVAFHCIYSLDA
jgi:hypothetical protein